MRRAGLVVAAVLRKVAKAAEPGVTTGELDQLAADTIAAAGAMPSFLGYYGYPKVLCVSVNDEIVHGIPGDRVLQDGDLVSVDCGAIVAGWHGDAAVTFAVGEVSPEAAELSETTRAALWAGLSAAQVGNRIGDIGAAVTAEIRRRGNYGIVEDFVGHGIGSAMHMEPPVPNLGEPGTGPKLKAGMAIAIEPMVTLGSQANRTLGDNWTVVTQDAKTAAHWEHTVAITAEGPWVLTEPDGGASNFAKLGIASPAADYE